MSLKIYNTYSKLVLSIFTLARPRRWILKTGSTSIQGWSGLAVDLFYSKTKNNGSAGSNSPQVAQI